jgi:molybdopterin synthase catalytic subunit
VAACEPLVRVQAEDFDLAAEVERLTAKRSDIGAVVTFTGRCRDEGGRLAALELEHYPGMAEAEIGRVARQAAERWALGGLTVIHRYGKIRPGENIVLVVAASRLRKAALEAADFLMDYLKSRAPFWKKEHPASDEEGRWVEAKAEDEKARDERDLSANSVLLRRPRQRSIDF